MSSDKLNAEDVDTLRHPAELPHHWSLRREFLLTHKDKFSLDRLICLSKVFVNVECMGLTYPDEVMIKVKELGSTIDKSVVQTEFLEEEPEPSVGKNTYTPPNQRNFHQQDQRRGGHFNNRSHHDADWNQHKRNGPPQRGGPYQQGQSHHRPFPGRNHEVEQNQYGRMGPAQRDGHNQQEPRYGRPFPASNHRNQYDDNSRRRPRR